MSEYVHTSVSNGTGFITLDRPKALNSLSLAMVRDITQALMAWRDDSGVAAVVIRSSSEKAFCAGGDIRFFYDAGRATPQGGSALVEDFFTEEYALNHLIHFYPKPYIALIDGVVMGGGMGVAQGGPDCRVRIVTERTRMAMPEVNIGLFPDVGGSYFLARAPGKLGCYLGVTGVTIGAADALHAGLADHFVPGSEMAALSALLEATPGAELAEAIAAFAAPFKAAAGDSKLAAERAAIDRHFGAGSVPAIIASLKTDDSAFAQKTLQVMATRSPLMMCVTHELVQRGAALDVADCLRMERTLVRHNFEDGEVIEGVRALVIDKDNAPQWKPASLEEVSEAMVQRFFQPVWPDYAHPLRHLD
ncbi:MULTISPECIES: enoyl-CoA hydratase/isomerase family protein [unclassified Duganella]|uniref:enoyl-CoA hydratase/isomerase family protein n=1 Tax=unclassified Duganella TaxID=2636909 RepID=UPI000E34BA52|nr:MULTISPECIES: enoyl-CoA hydratase/isomerase family protein [unclassified Duganella]RFP10114.1 enoyl-CoA hydratase/isomerase family protein [Duganella sp. BJB475]RFP25580.1 enoyl-CoA hydratase/isomerase family protein [Duganella sp. BJB476]